MGAQSHRCHQWAADVPEDLLEDEDDDSSTYELSEAEEEEMALSEDNSQPAQQVLLAGENQPPQFESRIHGHSTDVKQTHTEAHDSLALRSRYTNTR